MVGKEGTIHRATDSLGTDGASHRAVSALGADGASHRAVSALGTGDTRHRADSTLRTYRRVVGLTGAALPVVSFLGRLPTATVQFGSLLLVARTSGSLGTAGLVGGALAVGQVACGPLVGRLADRHGQRTVVLVFSLANALAIAALVSGALSHLAPGPLALLGALAGASVPLVGPLARARVVALARGSGADDRTVNAALSLESTLDEISFVLGPALVGVAAVLAHPAYALGGAALLAAVCGSGFALHPTATATHPTATATHPRATATHATATATHATATATHPTATATHATATGTYPTASATTTHPARDHARTPGSRASGARPRIPRSVHALRAALALQGAMFGACQAGITALTERLGREDQAGLVYAAMGVMSAVAGLTMAAVPARLGLRLRWRAATAAALLLSLPLLWTENLWGLYAVVTVLGVAYAPHLITVFALTERAVPPTRLAEAMAFATSAIVGGQALAVAVTGRLAESYGPNAAFAVGSSVAALACAIALTARPTTYTAPEKALPTRVDEEIGPHTGEPQTIEPHARVHSEGEPHARVHPEIESHARVRHLPRQGTNPPP
ncbi:MFS transporter [Streptomyces sp. NPDC058466]|uniref:MFS transporter n=1 Tax=Streptomyces sp. NPDC058466 TaxID=3346512 RepID=UPI0036618411